jgi:UDP:flavonoid glycosyltransferase YjiC (YdhE family)
MHTVLLAWEIGGGFGHVANLRQIAAPLIAQGLRCIAAVKDMESAQPLREDGISVRQAPPWKPARSSVSMADWLGDAGLADAATLQKVLLGWTALFDEIKPELVIGDYAPGAGMAARGRIPLALNGNGYTLPPAEMASFPLLHLASPPVWSEKHLLETTNAALRDLGLQVLQRLPQIFAADAVWVQTFPLLDPYAECRNRPAQGGLALDGPMNPRGDGARQILVYLSSWRGRHAAVLEALRPFAADVRVFAAGLSAAEREHYAAMGIRMEDKPFDLARDLAAARLAIHLGSAGMAAACLLAGVPQLACATDIEKELTGKALVKAGIGNFLRLYNPAVSLTADGVQALLADQAMAQRAQAIGAEHRSRYGDADPLGAFIETCLKLLG